MYPAGVERGLEMTTKANGFVFIRMLLIII